MKYFVRKIKANKQGRNWKLQFRTKKKEIIQEYKDKGLVKPDFIAEELAKDIPIKDWKIHGFSEEMTLDQAKALQKQKNAEIGSSEKRKAQAKRLKVIEQELEVDSAYLPREIILEFEEILSRKMYGKKDIEKFYKSKVRSHWLQAKEAIRSVELNVKDWAEDKECFYNHFIEKNFSLSYCEKIILVLNKWGNFYSRKYNSFYRNIPFPKGTYKEKIADNYDDNKKYTKESDPLNLTDLINAETSLKKEQYNWLFVSLFFGLRPSEVDLLKIENDKHWYISQQGLVNVLNVYQPKIVTLSKSQRWKRIPCIFPEQDLALEMIKSGELKRPLVKVIKKHVGEGYTTYAGRKGFEKLLRDRGIEFEAISSYLGHANVDRTWKTYREKATAVIPSGMIKMKVA